MNMTEKDLEELLKKNPALKIKNQEKQGRFPSSRSKSLKPPAPIENEAQEKKEVKNKYLNKKLYEYENGVVSESKNEEKCGKIIYTFDSVKEYERWKELQILQVGGEITDLERQIALLIQPAFAYRGTKIRKIEYVADFIYKKSDEIVVEDVKPFDKKKQKYRLTKDFSLKWKLLKYRYPQYIFKIF